MFILPANAQATNSAAGRLPVPPNDFSYGHILFSAYSTDKNVQSSTGR